MRHLLFIPLVVAASFLHTASFDHVRYLSAKGEFTKAIEEYISIKPTKHNPEILEQICFSILAQGIKSQDPEKLMITIYSLSIARMSDSLHFLRKCIKSQDPNIQMAALSLLGQIHEDAVEEILCDAMASPYFPIRMEALYRLCQIKSKRALSYLESTKNLVPEEYCFLFPDLYMLIGSHEATISLRKMITSPHTNVKIASILSCGQFGRDDFLSDLRLCAKHINPAEQEATAFSLGALSDLQSVDSLKQLVLSSYPHVQLAASLALIHLGHHEYEKTVYKLAIDGHPFAIYALKDLPLTQSLLYELLKSKNPLVTLNASLALLYKKDPTCLPFILQMFSDSEHVDYIPIFSPGHSLFAWKPISKIAIQKKHPEANLSTLSLQFMENMIISALDLPDKDFYQLAEHLFKEEKQQLIPLLVRLLENKSTDESLSILQKNAQKLGNPLIRDYCLLALFRLNKDDLAKEQFISRLPAIHSKPLIQFRAMVERSSEKVGGRFELTPEEHSRLLLESCDALARRKDVDSIDQILIALKNGHPDNRPALAGILLSALH